jgi:hypothetical protein
MKTILNLFVFSLLSVIGLGIGASSAASKPLPGKPVNMNGKFYVSSVTGKVQAIADGRIWDIKKGDIVLARGAILSSDPGSNATIVFSNGTSFFIDEKTDFKVNKFDQQPFLPNNNLAIEPSNSDTRVTVDSGRLVISTPQLISGTSLVFETVHAQCSVLNDQTGGEKAFIEVNDKQTHFAVIVGAATVSPRGKDGNFVSIGTRLDSEKQAYVHYTLTGQLTMSDSAGTEASPEGAGSLGASVAANGAPAEGGAKAPGAEVVPLANAVAGVAGTTSVKNASAATGIAVEVPEPISPGTPLVATQVEAEVLRVTGTATSRPAASGGDTPLSAGTRLPQGAVIATGPESEVFLKPFDGAVAVIKPNSRIALEKLTVSTANRTVQKRTALLDDQAGSIVLMLDPAKRNINSIGIRTPKGIATAQGTSFSVSVTADNFSVTATADTVTFVTPSGTTYAIAAGNITITPAGGQPQPPIPLSQAVAGNAAIAAVVQTAVNTVANVVQNNIGNLPASSSVNIISQVVGVASVAMPSQAAAFTTQAITAVTAPSASTSGAVPTAAAAITAAAVTAVPSQAAQLAVAATKAAPTQSAAVAASAASVAPAQSSQIAGAVLAAVTQGTTQTLSSFTQIASTIGSAVSSVVPTQAGPVTGAMMQAITQANPGSDPAATTQAGATLAAAVTASVPNQAAPVATAVMQAITASNPAVMGTAQAMAQTAATLGSAVTSTAPGEAVPVATALMQFVSAKDPAAGASAAGLIAAAISQAAPPAAASGIVGAVASSSGQTAEAVAQGAKAASGAASAIAQGASSAVQAGAQASQSAGSASLAVSSSASVAPNVTSTTAVASGTSAVQATAIIVSTLSAGQLSQIAGSLNSAQGAQSTVTFNTSSGSDNSGSTPPSVNATPTVPSNLPSNDVISPAQI